MFNTGAAHMLEEMADDMRNMGESEAVQAMVESSVKTAALEALNPDVLQQKIEASEEIYGESIDPDIQDWIDKGKEALEIDNEEDRIEFYMNEVRPLFEEAGLDDEFDKAQKEIDLNELKQQQLSI